MTNSSERPQPDINAQALLHLTNAIQLEHFASRPQVEALARVFARKVNGILVAPPWCFIMMLKARSEAQLQVLIEEAAHRRLVKQMKDFGPLDWE